MEASTESPGAFALEVAALGRELQTTFTKFITTRKVQERRMESILATISITTSLLTDFGEFIDEHAYVDYINDDVTRPTCQTCKADFETLLVMTKESAEQGMWRNSGMLGGKAVTAEVDPWFLFNVGLGGKEKSADFWARIEATRYSLVALTDTVKYKIYKKLDNALVSPPAAELERILTISRNRLTTDQALEFKDLIASLPQLVKAIERSEETKKNRAAYEVTKAEQAEKDRLLKSSRNRPDVGHLDDIPPRIVISRSPSHQREHLDLDSASDITMWEPVREKKDVSIANDDLNSLYSDESMDTRCVTRFPYQR